MGAGALFTLGVRELLPASRGDCPAEAPGWTRQLDRFCRLPLPLLIGAGAALEVVSPDDLFLMAKGASALLEAQLGRGQELLMAAAFTLASSLLLLVPFLAVALARDRMLPLLESAKRLLFARGDLVVGGLSLALAAYLAWQGIEGLRMV